MARREATRDNRRTIPTIIGAGITEQWYFEHIRKLKGYRIRLRPRFFGSETADRLLKRINEVLDDEGIAICVFDADVSTWNEAERGKIALNGYEKVKNGHQYIHRINKMIPEVLKVVERMV